MNLPDFLTKDPYGYIHLTGHRIGLRNIVEMYKDGYTPEMLQDHFPTIPLAMIHKTIAFFLENQADVDAYVIVSREALDHQTAQLGHGPNVMELRRHMESRRQNTVYLMK